MSGLEMAELAWFRALYARTENAPTVGDMAAIAGKRWALCERTTDGALRVPKRIATRDTARRRTA